MYNIGFFFSSPSGYAHDKLVLCLYHDLFSFFLVSWDLIPNKYKWPSSSYSSNNLSFPVLCKLDNNRVNEIHFFADFPIQDSLREQSGFSIRNEGPNKNSVLLFNNEPLILSYFEGERAQRLVQLLTDYVVCEQNIHLLNKILHTIEPDCTDSERKRVISGFKKQIESFNLDRILATLKVSVYDHYRTKIGDDDTYSIYRLAEIEDDTVVLDNYLKTIIELGDNCIYEDRGYTGNLRYYAKEFLEKHPLGEYSGDVLEREKERIISLYSKEEHMAYLFFDQLKRQEDSLPLLEKWSAFSESIISELKSSYFAEKILSLDYKVLSNYNKELDSINSYMYRVQKYPILRVIITGSKFNTPINQRRPLHLFKDNDSLYYKAIGDMLHSLLSSYNVQLISGNAVGSESLALRYACQNRIDTINKEVEWTYSGNDRKMKRYYEMAKLADVIYITGNPDYYLAINFKKVANELNIPIKAIEVDE